MRCHGAPHGVRLSLPQRISYPKFLQKRLLRRFLQPEGNAPPHPYAPHLMTQQQPVTKSTKIVATLGPASSSEEVLTQLHRSGVIKVVGGRCVLKKSLEAVNICDWVHTHMVARVISEAEALSPEKRTQTMMAFRNSIKDVT